MLQLDSTPLNESKAIEELESLLQSAIELRLRSDVTVGSLMSSGIDSPTIVALASRLAPGIQTFTVGYGKPTDETAQASEIAGMLGTTHNTYYLSQKDLLDTVDLLPEIFDEPLSFPAAVPTYPAFREARRNGLKVVLVGDGADELFWGYEPGGHRGFRRYLGLWPVHSLLAPALWTASNILSPLPQLLPGLSPRWLPRVRDRYQVFASSSRARMCFTMMRAVLQEKLEKMLVLDNIMDPIELLPLRQYDNSFERHPVEATLLLDLTLALADNHLDRVDRASMAQTVEARSPYLDYRVVEYALRIPMALKRRHGMTKYLLKRVLAQHLPRRLWDQPKRGFGGSPEEWLRGPLHQQTQELIAHADPPLNRPYLLRQLRRHVEGNADESVMLWSVFVFLQWWERWMRR